MKPIYFPFTYMSGLVLSSMTTCFEQTCAIQPSPHTVPEGMRRWAAEGFLHLRYPETVDNKLLAAVCRDYRQWAETHGQGALSYLKAGGDVMGFYDEMFSSQIGSDIKKYRPDGMDTHSRPPKETDPEFTACVFLSLAQEFDIQQDLIHQGLFRFREMEKDLMERLKGENDFHAGSPAEPMAEPAQDPGAYMTARRMESWGRLISRDPSWGAEAPDLYVTHSPSVMSLVLETFAAAERVVTLEAIPVMETDTLERQDWRGRLDAYIHRLLENPRTAREENFEPPAGETSSPRMVLTLYRVPGESPRNFFSRFIRKPALPVPPEPRMNGASDTLLALVTYQGFEGKHTL